MLPVMPRTFSPAGRLAIVGVSGVNALGTAQTSYQVRTGRFTDAVPELARLMGLVQAKDGQLFRAQRIVADRAVPVENDDGKAALSPEQIVREYGDYIDHNIGIRVIRPGIAEDGFDPQRMTGWPKVKLDKATLFNGRELPAGTELRLPVQRSLKVSHAGIIPSGWDIKSEMGFRDPVSKKFARMQWIAARLMAGGMISMGVPWDVVATNTAPEQRKVAVAPGMGPGQYLMDGMAKPILGEPIQQWLLAQYLLDYEAFLYAKWIDARHASSRAGACNTGICNMEDLVAAMRSQEILFGAVATFESVINVTSLDGFAAQKALVTDTVTARQNDHPSLASCPGLKRRGGFVMGEGGGLLFLMPMELAMDLGLIIYGEFLSAKTALGARESLDPAAPTKGVTLAMERGLREWAQLDGIPLEQAAAQIDLINGHGTSTPAGDVNGALAYESFLERFGRSPQDPVLINYAKGGPRIEDVDSARSLANGTGHLLGGAASAATVENISIHEEGLIPPAVSSLGEVDPEILEARRILLNTSVLRHDVDVAVAEAEGFGDSNGGAFTRRYAPERYRGGKEIQGQQDEAKAYRDEQVAKIREGRAKPADYLPPLKLTKG